MLVTTGQIQGQPPLEGMYNLFLPKIVHFPYRDIDSCLDTTSNVFLFFPKKSGTWSKTSSRDHAIYLFRLNKPIWFPGNHTKDCPTSLLQLCPPQILTRLNLSNVILEMLPQDLTAAFGKILFPSPKTGPQMHSSHLYRQKNKNSLLLKLASVLFQILRKGE